MEIAALGLKVESHEPERAADALNRLSKSAQDAERSSGRFGERATTAGRKARAANEAASKSADRMAASYGKLNAALVTAAKRMLAFGAATVGLAAMSRTLADFEQSMASVSAITRASADDLAELRNVAKEIGATTEFSASQAADGIKFLGMAGFDAQQTIAAFADVVDLATASQMDLAQAADIATNMMSAFGIAAENAADVADVIAAATARANTDVSQLGEAMKKVGPVASSMGVSINDTAAAIGALSDAGIQGSMAGTGLTRILSTLANPTKQAADAIRGLGLNVSDLDPQTTPIVDIVQKLRDAGLSAADAFTIFGDRGAPAILALVENEPKLRSLTEALSDVGGEASRMAEVMRDNLAGDFKGLQSAIESVIIAIGEAGLIAVMRAALQGLTDLIRRFSEAISLFTQLASAVGSMLAPAFDALKPILGAVAESADIAVAAIAGFYAPAMLGGLALLTKALAVGLVNAIRMVTAAMMANPIGLIVGALVAAGYAVYKFRDQISEAIGVDLPDIFNRATFLIAETLDGMYAGFTGVMAAHMRAAEVAVDNIRILFMNAFNRIREIVSEVMHAIVQQMNSVFGTNIETTLFVSAGPESLRSITKEVKEAFLEGQRNLGLTDWLIDRAIYKSLDEQPYTTGIDDKLAGSGDPIKPPPSPPGGPDANAIKYNDDYIMQLQERIALLHAETEYEQLLARLRVGTIKFSTDALRDEALAHAQALDFLEEQMRAVEEAKLQAEEYQALMHRLYPEQAEYERFIADVELLHAALEDGYINIEQYIDAMARLENQSNETFNTMTAMADMAFTSVGNSIADMLATGEADFKSFADGIVREMMRMMMQAMIIQPLMQAMGFASGGYVGGSSSYAPDISGYYASGGYTGDGGKYEPAGIVHRGEYVFSKAATQRIGVPALERLHRGYATGGYVGSSVATGSGAPSVELNIINQSGQPVSASQPKVSVDNLGRMVVDVMITDLQRNGPYARQLKGTLG